ncbi:MAG TPA: right-handed parallel beta-helix repeat-containing protein, partial [Armatimonadota bacterium]|nr:right-handed parallel beta-helix repeat-containing protein [Armatimonadota bacterium]
NMGTLIVNDCAVSGNYAGKGGAIVNYGILTANDCLFDNNRAGDCGGIADYGKVLFNGCIFSHNAALGGYVGALASINPVLINCAFYNNGAKFEGGAIISDTLLAINCVFCGNGAYGDVIQCGALTAVNCTISNNHSVIGCTVACGTLDADNCILWGNTTTYGATFGPDFNPSLYTGKQSVVKYSDVEGGWPGAGNLNIDPLFVDADGPDDIRGNGDDDLRLRPDSPCLNKGNNAALLLDTFDLDEDGDISEVIPYDRNGDPRVSGSVVDMGAYEVDLQTLSLDALAALRSAVEDLVRNGALLPADGQPLYAKLDAALAALEAGNLRGAAGVLTAFSKQIQELVKTGKLSPENGVALLSETSRASLLFSRGG